jgi:DNA-binding NarL/FixJ family response regulator
LEAWFLESGGYYTGRRAMGNNLTPRQVDMLRLIRDGCSNKQIAYQLGLKEQTVKNSVCDAILRLGVHNRTAAVIKAIRLGYFDLSDDGG